ncbi:hypothetical protein RCJ22_17985 [Vibrio sp. FNV 38]|nr:hypothetical protein [Vibrio sp. FNV 38]
MLNDFNTPLNIDENDIEINELKHQNNALKNLIRTSRTLIEINELKADKFKHLDTIETLKDSIFSLKSNHASEVMEINKRHSMTVSLVMEERNLYFNKWKTLTSELTELKNRIEKAELVD